MRRRFSRRERAVLYRAAGGRCTDCGEELGRGWHADHEYPWALGGATDVANGRALCAACNLRKGQRVKRQWQQEAFDVWLRRRRPDWLCEATPAAGKTRFALHVMQELRTPGRRFVVVVPTSRLRQQWSQEAHAIAGLDLDPNVDNGRPETFRNIGDGIVVTYHAVASDPAIYRHQFGPQTVVVLDEVHHCGDEKAWGDAIRSAFELCGERLLLSGTPFRGDNSAIPFVEYAGDPPTSKPDFRYGYGRALIDGVVRPVEFKFHDAEGRWVDAGAIRSTMLATTDAESEEERRALASALQVGRPGSQSGLSFTLEQAHHELQRVRRDMPDAGGLVIADDTCHADEITAAMRRISGVTVRVAHSAADDGDAQEVIKRFTRSHDPWLVAVNMVTEGVDIPRLMVGVYATRKRTPLFFKQAVGRFVRVRGNSQDSVAARLFMPKIPTFVTLANEIELERDHALREMREREQRDATAIVARPDITFLPARDPRYAGSILRGEEYSSDACREAQELATRYGVLGSDAQIAALVNDARDRGRPAAVIEEPVSMTPAEQRQELRDQVNAAARFHAIANKLEFKDVYKRLARLHHSTVPQANEKQLEGMLRSLQDWAAE